MEPGLTTDEPAPWVANVLGAGGELGGLVGEYDWAGTPLGPIDTWPQSLRTAVSMCLTSRFPIVLWWGPELRMIYNDAYRPILGASKHPAALGAPGREIWPEIWDVIGPMLGDVMAGRGATWSDDQLLLLDRNGFLEECYFTFSYSPIVAETGETSGVFCAVTETTERIVGARRLATLGSLAAGLVDAVSPEQACERAVALLTANDVDVPAAEVHRAERLTGALADAARSRHGLLVEPGSYAVPVVEPGGTGATAVLVVRLNPHRPFDDGYRSFLDLTAGHLATAISGARAYASQRRRVRALAELDAAKTTFFANIGHELRTPLTLILGPVADALDDHDDPLPPRQRARVELIARSAARLRRLVNGMLDFARIEAGRVVPEPAAVDLARATTALVHNFTTAVERAGLSLRLDAPPLPRPTYVDREMWDQVVLNLLSNAVKYTLHGEIRVVLRDVGEAAELSVSDTGVGIPAEELPLLFERFYRVRGVEGRTQEGSGIGLAMVRELLRLLDGAVRVESTPGVGTTFTVRLPYGQPVAPGPNPQGPNDTAGLYVQEALSWASSPPARHHVDSALPRLLIAEDNPDLRSYLEDLLSAHYDTTSAADGADALALAREQRPDLLLADVLMPRLDGYGLLAAVRGDPALRDLPVVLLSARAGEEAAAEGFAAGADDYLVKPFSSTDLLTRLRANLDRAAARSRDAAWRTAMTRSLRDGLFIADTSGLVVEVNDAFGQITGFGPEGAPYAPPYPWWPTLEQDPGDRSLLDLAVAHLAALGGGDSEMPFRHREGHRVWVSIAVTSIDSRRGDRMMVGTVRDITRERGLLQRRGAAAKLAAAMAAAENRDDLLAATVHGFAEVFDGPVAVIPPGRQRPPAEVVTAEGTTAWKDLPARTRRALSTRDLPDPPPGLLISAADHQVWVQFPAPRAVGPDERLLAHLLGDVLATGLGRATREASRAHTEDNLRAAIDSHRFIGQAVGILMERHRLTATAAFERLRTVSQQRNIKLRDLADHIIATGEELA